MSSEIVIRSSVRGSVLQTDISVCLVYEYILSSNHDVMSKDDHNNIATPAEYILQTKSRMHGSGSRVCFI